MMEGRGWGSDGGGGRWCGNPSPFHLKSSSLIMIKIHPPLPKLKHSAGWSRRRTRWGVCGAGVPPRMGSARPRPFGAGWGGGGGWDRAIYGRALLCVCIPPPGRDAPLREGPSPPGGGCGAGEGARRRWKGRRAPVERRVSVGGNGPRAPLAQIVTRVICLGHM